MSADSSVGVRTIRPQLGGSRRSGLSGRQAVRDTGPHGSERDRGRRPLVWRRRRFERELQPASVRRWSLGAERILDFESVGELGCDDHVGRVVVACGVAYVDGIYDEALRAQGQPR